jgi:hypothetical protein
MVATTQKIRWADRAIDEMREAQSAGLRDEFHYHFGMFLALIGALRHFISVDPHKQWVHSLDQQNVYYCSCLDLRNIDVHITNAGNGKFSVVVDDLPAAFTEHSYTHEPRSTKSQELQMLGATPAVEVAERALEFFKTTVLPGAQARGVPIP